MKRYTSLLPKRILDYREELIEDLELNDMVLHDKSMKCPGIKAKWLTILFEEEALLQKLDSQREKTIENYIEKYGKPGVPKFKIEDEARRTDQIEKLDRAIKAQKEVTRFLVEAYKIVSAFNFEISNAVKIVAMEQ